MFLLQFIEGKEALLALINRFRNDYSEYKDSKSIFNEQMTRQQYIDPFLKLLGWDITNSKGVSFYDREVVAEEYANRKDRPDYTIRIHGAPIFFVEAKKVNVAIESDKNSALQVRRYGWNAGHSISVLTNFDYLAIYQTYENPSESDESSTFRYKLYHFEEYLDKFEEIYSLLSYESVRNGDFQKWISDITPEDATKLTLDSVFLKDLNRWRVTIASDLIQSENKYFADKGNLNEAVQQFLNQIVFLRFAEDNHLEDSEILKKLLNKKLNAASFLLQLDKKYNAGIFNDSRVVGNLSGTTLNDIVMSLYFPQSSYDFSVIDLSILSRIYENFLQEEINIVDGTPKLEKTRDAKIKSVVSTPDELVKLMVHKVLEPKISGKNPSEILSLKIVDLAVGSGIFLIEAYNYLENYLADWYGKEMGESPSPLLIPYKDKSKLIESVLYGFDINFQAVQLTRFSLILRVLLNENSNRLTELPILPNLKKNIIHGNALIDETDVDMKNLNIEDIVEIVPFNTDENRVLLYDIVIGNPPYLTTEDIKKSTPITEINVYKEKYFSAYKQFDKYFLFIEKALEILNDDGRVSVLVPNKFVTIASGIKIRQLIKEKQALVSIVDFGVTQLFHGITNYVSILEMSKNHNNSFTYSRIGSIAEAYEKREFEYDIHKLSEKTWFLTNDLKFKNQYEFAANHFPSIKEEINTPNGIQTSKNSFYVIDKKYIVADLGDILKFEKNGESFYLEKGIARDFYQSSGRVQGKSYQSLSADKLVIFPYENSKLIPIEQMLVKYPNAWEYFQKHKEELLPKQLGGSRDVQNNPSESNWYQYGRTQFLTESTEDKIIVGVMSNQPNFNIDRNGYLFASGGTAGYISIFMRDESPYCLEYIQAWLSHPFTDKIFRTLGSDFDNGFYSHGTYLYDEIPILPVDFDNEQQALIYSNIVTVVKKIEKINSTITNEVNSQKLSSLERQKVAMILSVNSQIDSLLSERMGDLYE
ncbi:Eco57I restriction-modification methylase domain-containing protein [Listeria booriae]|uniref:Eco57I restriction-modification methylase domain-containing protein n=1 Tax=Listeria booriae TaxID=1552123 RepID=UPI0028A126A9|nr:N-6 DNA methylase [Listeria booriae]